MNFIFDNENKGIIGVAERTTRLDEVDDSSLNEDIMAIIQKDPSNYSFVYSRLQYLEKQCTYLEQAEYVELLLEELIFTKVVVYEHEKAYVPWTYRWSVLEKCMELDDTFYSKEWDILNELLTFLDSKNHNYWMYRARLLAYKSHDDAFYLGEYNWINALIKEDIFNNSYWTYRTAVTSYRDDISGNEEMMRQQLVDEMREIWKLATEFPFNNMILSKLKNSFSRKWTKQLTELQRFPDPYTDICARSYIRRSIPSNPVVSLLAQFNSKDDIVASRSSKWFNEDGSVKEDLCLVHKS